jgi:hypothetical protein
MKKSDAMISYYTKIGGKEEENDQFFRISKFFLRFDAHLPHFSALHKIIDCHMEFAKLTSNEYCKGWWGVIACFRQRHIEKSPQPAASLKSAF